LFAQDVVTAMPLITVQTSIVPPDDSQAALLKQLSSTLAQQFQKPETYVMTALTPGIAMTFGGTSAPSCYVEVKNIGTLTPDQTRFLSREICQQIKAHLAIDPARISHMSC
jgi:phenylpyruvate tautomerase